MILSMAIDSQQHFLYFSIRHFLDILIGWIIELLLWSLSAEVQCNCKMGGLACPHVDTESSDGYLLFICSQFKAA